MRRPDDTPAPRLESVPAGDGAETDTGDEGGPQPRGLPAPVKVCAPTPQSLRLRELIMKLGRYRSLRDPIHGVCEAHSLTPTQIHAIIWLGNDGPTNLGVLAQRIGINKKTITGVVDRLEHMTLVERVRDAHDRRAVTARLTAGGESVYQEVNRSMDQGLQRMLAMLTPEDQASLFGMMERVLQRLALYEQAV